MNRISRRKISTIGVIGAFILTFVTLRTSYVQEVVFQSPAEKEVASEVKLKVHDTDADSHSEESKCDFQLVYNLNDTYLGKIQERKEEDNKWSVQDV